MDNSTLFKQTHKMTRKICNENPDVNYQTQFGICLKYLKQSAHVDILSVTMVSVIVAAVVVLLFLFTAESVLLLTLVVCVVGSYMLTSLVSWLYESIKNNFKIMQSFS